MENIITKVLILFFFAACSFYSKAVDLKNVIPVEDARKGDRQHIFMPLEQPKIYKKNRKPFSKEEDAILMQFVGSGRPWEEITEYIPDHREKECKERYRIYLKPGIKKDPWTPEDDFLLLEKVGLVGTRWALICSKCFPGRVSRDLQNRYAWLKYQSKKSQNVQIQHKVLPTIYQILYVPQSAQLQVNHLKSSRPLIRVSYTNLKP
jgi:hypothetical protein